MSVQCPLLLSWFNFNPSRDKQLHAWKNVGWNYLSIPNLQRLQVISFHSFHSTLYNLCIYLSMLGLKLNYVDKRAPRSLISPTNLVSDETLNQAKKNTPKFRFIHPLCWELTCNRWPRSNLPTIRKVSVCMISLHYPKETICHISFYIEYMSVIWSYKYVQYTIKAGSK